MDTHSIGLRERRESFDMGKAKKQRSQLVKGKATGDKPQGSHKAFKVSQHKATKAKHKAKAVSTNLKRLNFQNRQQVNRNNERFTDVQQSWSTAGNKPIASAAPKPKAGKISRPAQPNMDEAAKQMAML